MRLVVRGILLAAVVLAGASFAAPALASTTPPKPPVHLVSPGTDEVHIPGVAPDVPQRTNSNLMHTDDLGGGASGVQQVYVSVVSATASGSDNVNTGMTKSAVSSAVSQLSNFWSAQSGGVVTIQLAGYESRSLGFSSCTSQTAIGNVFNKESSVAFGGKFAGNAWLGTNTHLIILTTESCGAQAFATVGGSGGEVISGNGLSSAVGIPTLMHEFGHNLGFDHADASICTNTSSYDAALSSFGFTSSTCPTTEYDDFFDIMGYTVSGATPALSSPQRIMAGWLTNYYTATDATTINTVTLSPLTGSTGTRAIEITDPIGGGTYYVEYRAPVGSDASSAEFRYPDQCDAARNTYQICHLGSPSTGVVRILKALPFSDGNGGTSYGTTVLATSLMPGSSNQKLRNTRLAIGKAFTNYDAGFSVTVNSVSLSSGASITVVFPIATSTDVSIAPPTQTYGTAEPASVAVHVASGADEAPTGTVTFYDGAVALGSAVVSSTGDANYVLPATLVTGAHTITARFTSSTAAFKGSTSTVSKVIVARATSTVAVKLSSLLATRATRIRAVVTLRAGGLVSPTGPVAVLADGKVIETVLFTSADRGRRMLLLPAFVTKGMRTITVRYLGSSNVHGVTSRATRVSIS
ncbi:MAG TPA: Ig-like domain repeat protein [Galbitalea sp.]